MSLGVGDLKVIAALRGRGDIALIERDVSIWIYGEEAELHMVAARLDVLGWTNVEPYPSWDGLCWVIRCRRMQQATETVIDAMSIEISDALAGTLGDFDGWETSIQQAN